MKLEQTIQRSQKSIGGIVGDTRQICCVTKWEMIYHHISVLFWDLIKTSVDSREYDLHHELYELYGAVFNEDVCKVKKYSGALGNLSTVIRLVKLHNFITFATVFDAAEMRPLGFKDTILAWYFEFRTTVYTDGTERLSDEIKRANLPDFGTQPGQTEKQSNTKATRKLWKFHCPLFEEKYLKKAKKHILVSKLLQMIGKRDILFSKKSALNNVLLTDCMSVIRWKPFTRFYIFIDLFSSI